MKTRRILFVLCTFVLMSFLLASCVKNEADKDLNGSVKLLKSNAALPIYMGQHTLVGTAFISVLNDDIVVDVDLDEGIVPNEAHLYVGEVPPPSSAPGQFPYHWYTGEPLPVSFTIDIPDSYNCAFGLYFALHLAIGNETAWILPSEGGMFWYNKKGNKIGWGQYFYYTFDTCGGGEPD